MVTNSFRKRIRLVWNWIMGKRIRHTCRKRGRVLVKTGRNSANRNSGGQWYIQRYESTHGTPPLPRCCRGSLDNPGAELQVERFGGDELALARRWYESNHGPLEEGQKLDLVCVFDPGDDPRAVPLMQYRSDEVFEIEYPWLSSYYDGPEFVSYFGTWYGQSRLQDEDTMDFEIFWDVKSQARPLPDYGASW